MLYGKKFIMIFITLASVALLSGCVGTVKTNEPEPTKSSSSSDSTIQEYPGINSVKSIADDRIEIYFSAIAGDVDEIAYVIRYGGQLLASYVPANSLKPDYRGLLKFTMKNLQADKLYDFSVQARNIKTGAESTNNVSKATRTFSNATAKFDGIVQVRNLPGASGLNGVEVFWNEAEVRGGLVSKDEVDPIEYRITAINANSLNPGNMNDTSFADPLRKTFSVSPTKRSSIINGLNPGTKYYIQVRAIHFGYSTNSSNAAYKVEENTNYLEISTYTDDIANLIFDTTTFATSYPAGSGGLSSVVTSWASPGGNFDHYRIYYAVKGTANVVDFLNSTGITVNPFCFGAELANSLIKCEYIDYTKNSHLLTGLVANTIYDIVLAVCLTSDCSISKRLISTLKLHITTPPMASFTGILNIDKARDLAELNNLFLNFNSPDFTSGNISGLLVDYYGSNSNSTPIPLNDSDVPNTSELQVLSFDYSLDTTIVVSGIDPSSASPYCFMVYPFTFNADGSKKVYKEGLKPKCQVPSIEGPTALAFTGMFSTSCFNSAKEAIIEWKQPTSGVFDKFEVYYAKNVSVFSFALAIDPANTAYKKVVLDSSQTSLNLTDLEPGANYKFGVLTRYQSPNGTIRSEFNTSIGVCSF